MSKEEITENLKRVGEEIRKEFGDYLQGYSLVSASIFSENIPKTLIFEKEPKREHKAKAEKREFEDRILKICVSLLYQKNEH